MITVYPPDPLMPLGRNRPLTHTSPLTHNHHRTTTRAAPAHPSVWPVPPICTSGPKDLRQLGKEPFQESRCINVGQGPVGSTRYAHAPAQEAHEKALRNAYTSRCTPRPKCLHQPRQDSDAHSSVHGNTPEDPSGSRQATIHPARTPRGRSSVPSLVAPRRTCGVLGSWNHAAH